MQKMRTEKGITLIALIITIIVMLILVGVSVTVALNGGLFSTAKTATDNTIAERDRELSISNGDIVDQYLGGSTIEGEWIQDKTKISKLNADGTKVELELEVGDTVNYATGNSDYTGEWAVLGVEDGNILLMTKKKIAVNVTDDSIVSASAWAGSVNAVIEEKDLDAGINAIANSQRIITMADIDRIAGFTSQSAYGEGISKYGNKIKFEINEINNYEEYDIEQYVYSYEEEQDSTLKGNGNTTISYFWEDSGIWPENAAIGQSSTFELNYYTYNFMEAVGGSNSKVVNLLCDNNEKRFVTTDYYFGVNNEWVTTGGIGLNVYAGGLASSVVSETMVFLTGMNAGPEFSQNQFMTAAVIKLNKDVSFTEGTTTDLAFATVE